MNSKKIIPNNIVEIKEIRIKYEGYKFSEDFSFKHMKVAYLRNRETKMREKFQSSQNLLEGI